MKLTDYMDQKFIFTGLAPADKPALLENLTARVSKHFPEVNGAELLRNLTRREADGSTGIGHGVAVPHATITGLPETVCVLATLSTGIDFDAIDRHPVRLVFLLVSPPGQTGLHIKLLARIARLVKSGEFIEAAAACPGPEALYERIEREDGRHGE